MNMLNQTIRVLSIDPANRGFGFTIMEGKEKIIDWGVKEVRGNAINGYINKVIELIDLYQPDIIVVEDSVHKDSRRCQRVKELIKRIIGLAKEKWIKTYSYSRSDIRKAFSQLGVSTKYKIAQAISKQFPGLSPRLPPYRKCFMPEDYRMAIFDAISFALTFYHFKDKKIANKSVNKDAK